MNLLEEHTNNQILTLTLNRPDRRNALNAALIEQLLARLAGAAADDRIRVLILTGAGDRAFCAGADLSGDVGGAGTARYAELLQTLLHFPKPTIARINGYCLAGGMGLMLACDITIAHEAAQFGTPEVNVGLWPMMIGALIARNMSPKQAMPMVMLGERFTAQQAMAWGLLSYLVPNDVLDRKVQDIAAQLARKSPIGMKLGKAAFHAMQEMPLEKALPFLQSQLARLAATEDAREGIEAFLEKRQPRFTGR